MMIGEEAFAEGDTVCTGKVMGETTLTNANVGKFYFDAHQSPNPDANQTVDLSIIGITDEWGLAPGTRQYAACASDEDSSFPRGTDEYILRGYGWSDDVGFISFYCDGESGVGENEGVNCGDWDYKVEIYAEKGGIRQISGNAWNEALGYIDFDPAYFGGVTMNATGELSGYAWSEAEVWIDFSGVVVELPGEEIEITEEWCDGRPWLCVQVDPDPDEVGDISIGDLDDIKLADGDEHYEIHLYLREEDGVTPLDMTEYQLKDLKLNWIDTVKINQLTGNTAEEDANRCGKKTLNDIETPWRDGCGAVVYKPVAVSLDDFEEVTGDPGHYLLDEDIRSYAPTTNANISYTTSIQPPVPFFNEYFFTELVDDDKEPWTDDIEQNILKLESIEFELVDKDGKPVVQPQVVYPNGKDGLSFKFRPPVEVNTLYANDLQDTILAYRGIPTNFRVGTTTNGDFSFEDIIIDFILDYEELETIDSCTEKGKNVMDFDFLFLHNEQDSFQVKDENLGSEMDVQAVAALPDYDPENEEQYPCSIAQGPTLYSEIQYYVEGDGGMGTVAYYGNKLPRITSMVVNPVAVVHGNIYAAEAFSPAAESQVQATGNVAIDVVRNTVNENVRKYLSDVGVNEEDECTVETLNAENLDVACIKKGDQSYAYVTVNDENVLYFKNSEVHLELLGGDDSWVGKWVLIIDGGRLFIDDDVYRADGNSGLAVVQMRPYNAECADGNIYINFGVKNIQANMVTDCSLFSYDPLYGIDINTGFPDWPDFTAMVNSLNNQLLIEGSIASRNTIGGADLDVAMGNPKDYLLLGTGEILRLPVTSEERRLAQLYDLNYLRLFKLDVQKSEAGLPIDQSCGKALTIEEMIEINQGGTVYGERINPLTNDKECNGIDSTTRWDPDDNFYGDLVPVNVEENMAKGLDTESDFDPIYIFYEAPDSFVFEKTGAFRSR
ncbi:hypothetical protein GF366_00540 [Candidatus Peregrinibacteria bacterium]|nr:hypothetical protein [Candidatus Peregrinibacteria bacterium]